MLQLKKEIEYGLMNMLYFLFHTNLLNLKFMKMKKYLSFIAGALLCVSATAQIELSHRSTSLVEIGKLKNLTSKEIESSKLGIGFETLDRKVFDPSNYYDKVGDIGVKWARCQTGWARTETEKGKYDFSWLDDVVDNLLKRGIQPWFNVGYGNPIYMGKVSNPTAVGYIPLYYGEECVQAWRNYVRNLAEHFKGRVHHFEIWNEPEINPFWQPKKADPVEYAKMIKITAEEIKKANPNAIIGACSAMQYGDYTETLFENAGKLLDFYSVHAYCMIPEHNYPNHIKSLRQLMKDCGMKTQIWQGETGFPSKIPAKSWVGKALAWHGSNETMQAKSMLRRYITDLRCGIDMTSFFMVTDFSPSYIKGDGNGMNTEAVWGIIENKEGYRPKKVYYVMRNFCSMFSNKTTPAEHCFRIDLRSVYPTHSPTSKLAVVATSNVLSSYTRNGHPVFCYYMPEDPQMEMRTIENISMEIRTKKMPKNPVLIDMMNGKVYKISDVGKKYLRGLPLTDYPLFVTDLDAISDIFIPNK